MSKINFTIASIVLFGAGFNASRWFEISTVEQFDNQFNETVALIQVRYIKYCQPPGPGFF